MTTVSKGDTVFVHFTGKLEDGSVFLNSTEQEPLRLVIGEGQFLPGIEDALIGMAPGDKKTATLPPEQGFGPHREDQVVTVDRARMPSEVDLKVGLQLSLKGENEEELRVVVTDLGLEKVTLDANHPLAGRSLLFDIELVEIVPATP